jgi:hypothetical protein
MTPKNAAASKWWEEVLAFFCEPPISDIFVCKTKFDGKDFERIKHIEQHVHPSGAVDSLGYIFNLIDIKKKDDKPVISLKACFLMAFSLIKMGGINIKSALQVGSMLCALLSCYHAAVQKFCLNCHPLLEASLQTVVDQCVNYGMDLFLDPVSKNSKVARTPSENAAGSGPRDGKNAYEVLASKSFNYHFGHWKKVLAENKGKCMFCHKTARNSDHKTRDCPILKKLGLKLEKRSKLDSNIDATSTVMAPPVAESTKPAAATPAPSSDAVSGLASLPGGFSAAAEQDLYDLGHEYDYKGKSSGSMYSSSSAKPKIFFVPM